MDSKWRKLFGPVMTTGLLLVYLTLSAVRWASIPFQGFEKFLGIAIPLGLRVSACTSWWSEFRRTVNLRAARAPRMLSGVKTRSQFR